MADYIFIKGAREHNLKNIDLKLPKNKVIVITGLSGSGKSSLAYDTLYAEGQRRYVESLSAYARQFLGVMSKPDVDYIEGLSPAISIDQKKPSHNPRSTVGTVTEIYDYLRLLFARIGRPYCPNCKIEIKGLSVDEIVKILISRLEELSKGNKSLVFQIFSPVVRNKKGEFKDLFANLLSKGYREMKVAGKLVDLQQETPVLAKTFKHTIEVIVDKLEVEAQNLKDKVYLSNLKSRLSASLEQSMALSGGLTKVVFPVLKIEWSFSEKMTCPKCGWSLPELEPRLFSFNSPLGACPRCKGIGYIYKVDEDRVLNKNLSINEGGILPFANFYSMDTWYIRLLKTVAEVEGIDLNTPIKDLPREKLELFLYGTGKVYRVYGKNRFGRETVIFERFNGIIPDLEKRFFEGEGELEAHGLGKYFVEKVCPSCQGARLRPEALSVKLKGFNISELTELSIDELYNFFKNELRGELNEFEKEVAKLILKEIESRLSFLINVGLSYLTLSRRAASLSGGEAQRIRLASQLGTGLSGVLYVLDEPSIGLHPRDIKRLINSLHNLRDLGNTLVIVEHDRDTILAADHVVELGPGSGRQGGRITFQGSREEFEKSDCLTARYVFGRKKIKFKKRELIKSKGFLRLKGVKHNNLKNVSIEIPLGNFVVVTGVSGSGKSSLVVETLYPALKYYLTGYFEGRIGEFETIEGYENIKRVYLVDQSPIGRTPRSNVATYIGFFDEIRELFASTVEARARGFTKSRFSFNLKGGRCEKCEGAGVVKIEMQFLSDVYVKCDLCKGKRYNEETLQIKYKGKTIYDVLEMTVEEALEFFSAHPQISKKLEFLKNVGLSYIKLGQPAPTFSGGESQRIKIASELSKASISNNFYILDEPTTGLHFADIEKLLNALYSLVDKGNTVVVIEHNLDVIKNAQYIIDLGPEGGEAGGGLLYQGQVEGIEGVKESWTGKYI